jgi:hypothetical protein
MSGALYYTFLASQALSLASLAIVLGGLAALQAYCFDNDEVDPRLFPTTTRSAFVTCSNFLRWSWFAWSFSVVSTLLLIIVTRLDQFRPLKTAVWSTLTAAIIQMTIICNAMVGLASTVDDSSPVKAQATAISFGMALFCLFAFIAIFSGTGFSYQKRQSPLQGVGIDSRRRSVTLLRSVSNRVNYYFNSIKWSKRSFIASKVLAWIGVVIVLGGLAAMQSYCFSNPAYFSSRILPWVTYPFTNTSQLEQFQLSLNCSTVFADKWWAWALSLAAQSLMALVWHFDQFAKYKAAVWALLISSATFNFTWVNNLLDWIADTDGTFKMQAQVTAAGFIIYNIAVFLILFAGSAYIHSSFTEKSGSAVSSRKDMAAGRVSVHRNAFLGLQFGAWIAQVIILVGLALYQSNYSEGGTYATAPIPSTRLRFHWFIWALQLVVLSLLTLTLSLNVQFLRQYKSAVWLVTVVAATLNMTVCSHLYRQFHLFEGSLQTYVYIQFAGFVSWDFFTYLAMFAGSAYAWESRHFSTKAVPEELLEGAEGAGGSEVKQP